LPFQIATLIRCFSVIRKVFNVFSLSTKASLCHTEAEPFLKRDNKEDDESFQAKGSYRRKAVENLLAMLLSLGEEISLPH